MVQAVIPNDALLSILHGTFIVPMFPEHSMAIRSIYSRLRDKDQNNIDMLVDEEDTVGIICLFSSHLSKLVVCETEVEWVHHSTEAEVMMEGGSRA
jgi:hypothetical protein